MKKGIFLVMLCCVLTGSLCAQNKRLSKIVENRLSKETTVQFTYDNQDRIVQMQISGADKTSVADFIYEGNEVRINHQYSSGTDTYVYHLADNKVQSSEIFLDVDIVNITENYEYSGDFLTVVANEMKFSGRTKTERNEFVWVGNNPGEHKYYYKGELETRSTFVYGNMSPHPLLSVLFGLGSGHPSDVSDDLLPLFGIYPFLGALPQNIWSQVTLEDLYENRTMTYNYDYTLNSDGDFAMVTVSGSSSATYELEWENAVSSIHSIENGKTITKATSIYNLKGQRLGDASRPGLVMVRRPDGTVTKVVVR